MPSLQFRSGAMANMFTYDIKPTYKFFEHKINPTLLNTEAFMYSRMTEDGRMKPYLDYTNRYFEQFLNCQRPQLQDLI